jgi:hypothetical protein
VAHAWASSLSKLQAGCRSPGTDAVAYIRQL